MSRSPKIAVTIAALLLSAPTWAGESQGTSVYPASFFDASHPATAADMITRLPGFILDTGNSQRGFAGTAGNVLIDGTRPTAKTDDLDSILARIPAASVDRIELIRGGVPGVDMQGQNVIANIVRKPGASNQAILTASNTLIEDGEWVPAARLEYHGTSGKLNYEVSLARTADQWDDSPGQGYRLLSDQTTGARSYDQAKSYGIMQLGWNAHGALTAPVFGGDWNNNVTLQTTDYSSGIAYSGNGGSRFDNTQRKRNGEFGSHWQGMAGPINLETLFLERLGDERDFNTDGLPGLNEAFTGTSNSGESILRITGRYAVLPELNLEAGGEGAYNFLNGHTMFLSNGVPVSLPNANVSVDERRGEAFLNGTWKPALHWTVEAGARFEFSNIAESGDTNLSRTFFYAKPRALVSWSLDDQSQIRLRAELKVGQLNFSDFVASSDLASFGVAAGNANLRPEQRWQFEANFERHFMGKGALVLSLLHEDITDLQDYIPVGSGLDAPGNISHASNDEIDLTGNIPLDWMGFTNALLKTHGTWRTGRVNDPVTGFSRPISQERDKRLSLELTQDLTGWHSTWGVGYLPIGGAWANYRIAEVDTIRIHVPYSWVYWIYNPAPDWSLKVQADNITPYRFELQQDIFAGPRNSAALAQVQDVVTRTRPRLFVQLRKTFG